MSKH